MSLHRYSNCISTLLGGLSRVSLITYEDLDISYKLVGGPGRMCTSDAQRYTRNRWPFIRVREYLNLHIETHTSAISRPSCKSKHGVYDTKIYRHVLMVIFRLARPLPFYISCPNMCDLYMTS